MVGFDFEIEDVVEIAQDLYVKTPLALELLLIALRKFGYEVDDLRQAEHRKRDNVSVEKMEKNGWSLWFARLPDIRRGKCNSCGSYISTRGIETHGHTCEVCGEVTYYHLIDGSTVRFEFIDRKTEGAFFAPQLVMEVHHWDTATGTLYLYPQSLESRSIGVLSGDDATAYLAKHQDKWKYFNEDGVTLIAVHYPDDHYTHPDDVISMMDSSGHYFNFSLIKLWGGKEYRDYDRLPVPEYISIYETWHWAPLPPSPRLHEKLIHAVHMVSDQGYYYQDGRREFSDYHFDEMGKFIRHFTTLNADEYDQIKGYFRKSGPGAIADLAKFCHPSPQITNQPNIGNTLVALGKSLSGEPLTEDELREARRGLGEVIEPKRISQNPLARWFGRNK